MANLHADLGPGVTALVTTRAGGVSSGPYATLDLALHVGDRSAHVVTNRAILERRVGAPVVYVNQVHGARVAVLPPEASDIPALDGEDADAIVTARSRVGLAVMVADCLPVLLADAGARVVGVAHAGRRGLAAGILPATVAAMRTLGARPESIRVYVGPAICGKCYEVGPQVQSEVGAVVPEAVCLTARGTAGLDLAAGAVAQLTASGVRSVEVAGVCTVEDARFYSYRRDGVTGRFAGVVLLEARDTPRLPA
jgi:YfiH family protein